jgi:CubicO group peptidase (beta-lactamase class C family)
MLPSSHVPRVLSRRTALRSAAGAVAASSLAALGPAGALARQSATPAAEGVTPDRVRQAVDALDGIVADGMGRTGVPGVSAAVAYQDEAVATRGYGVASTETNAPVDAAPFKDARHLLRTHLTLLVRKAMLS